MPKEATTSSPYLKTRVYRATKTYVCLFGGLLAWLDLHGAHFSWTLSAATLPEWLSSGLAVLATTAVALVDALPGDHVKAMLVFWRRKHPLPGSRAFERPNLDRDHRISVDRLKSHLDEGKLPRGPAEQNATWYRLYKTVKDEPEVAGIHYEYLLFRDLAWFTAVLGVAAIVSLALNWMRWRELAVYSGVAVVVFVLLARAASLRGERFVYTVLAVVAASPPPLAGATTPPSTTT